jgi:hypothetical protein
MQLEISEGPVKAGQWLPSHSMLSVQRVSKVNEDIQSHLKVPRAVLVTRVMSDQSYSYWMGLSVCLPTG